MGILERFIDLVRAELGSAGLLAAVRSAHTTAETNRSGPRRLPSGRRVALSLIVVAIAASGWTTATSAAPATDQLATFDLLLIGDSITEGTPPPGFRELLNGLLAFQPDIYTMVGSSGTAPLNGHFLGGQKICDFYPPTFGNGWGTGAFDTTPELGPPGTPNIAVIHVGTNDLNSEPPPYVPYSLNHGQTLQATDAGELGEYLKFLEQWANGPNSTVMDRIVLSLIIPLEGRDSDVAAFNEAVIAMSEDFAEGTATGSPLRVALADHYNRFLSNPDLFSGGPGDWMADALHPNDDGYAQMADVYRDAIVAVATDGTAPTAPSALSVVGITSSSVTLQWTVPGDDGAGGGNAAFYDARFSTSLINAANFSVATQAVGEPKPATPLSTQTFEVTGLTSGTTYFFAMKAVDDGGNRSNVSAAVFATTAGEGGDIVDDFNRLGPELGPNWDADPEYQIVASELANTSLDPMRIDFMATFTAASNPLGAGYRWSPTSDAMGRNQAGLALRLDAPSQNASGYLLYRDDPNNGYPNQWNLALIANGDTAGQVVSQVPSNFGQAPGANDELRVIMSSDANGHHFDILVNGVFDVRISDPNKQSGNSPTFYAGYLSRGGMNNNIDDFTLVTEAGPNLPPTAFDLLRPEDGSTLGTTHPYFDWEDSFDPDPGDEVTYTLEVSNDAGFPPAGTTTIPGIQESHYTWTGFLDRDQTYYWRVEARDLGGLTAPSNQTFSFFVPNLLSVTDDFERVSLGPDWIHDPANYTITSGELDNIDPVSGSFTLAVYAPRVNPTAASFRMGATADSLGFDAAAGFALMLDEASTTANGYMVYRNWAPFSNWQIVTLVNGNINQVLPEPSRAPATQAPPAAGDEIRVVMSSDPSGHHFDIYVRGQYDTRVTDPNKLFGNAPQLYAGYYADGGGKPNNIDDFTVTGVDFNSPPGSFDLVAPPDGTLVVSLAPLLEWSEAVDPNPDDQVSYTVFYDTDPALATPDSLPPTTQLSTPFTGALAFGESYHWRVRATDLGGQSVWSNSTWSFSVADTLTITDDFERPGPELGADWVADSGMEIAAGQLVNNSSSGLDLAVFTAATSPDAVELVWATSATATGIQRGGLVARMSAASSNANGYYIWVDPLTDQANLQTLVAGGIGVTVDSQAGNTTPPSGGSDCRVSLSSDDSGHHFDVFVDGNFYARLTDPGKQFGNEETLYAGVALRANQANNVEEFSMSAFNFGPPPADFALLEPPHSALGISNVPTFRWQAAGTTGMIYVVYVGTDSTLGVGGADSVSVQSDTTVVWPGSLPLDTDIVWQVRATDGNESRFNLNGWHWFRTVATPVELSRFEARSEAGRVVLEWQTSLEEDHLGFHVWRSREETGPPSYERLTDELVGRVDPREPLYRFEDAEVEAGQPYLYRIEAVDRSGGREYFGPVAATPLQVPLRLTLFQNTPNPFNPSTTIGFELPAPSAVRLVIYDVRGRLVRALVDEALESGAHQVHWDGRDDRNQEVGSGAYFYRLETGGEILTRKMILLR